MRVKRILLTAITVALFFSAAAHAGRMSSVSYTNMWNVYDCSGPSVSSASYYINSSVGEPAGVPMGSTSYSVVPGFQAFMPLSEPGPGPTPTPHHYACRKTKGARHRISEPGENVHVTEAGRISQNGDVIIIYSFYGNSAEDANYINAITTNAVFYRKDDIGSNPVDDDYNYVTGTAGY